MFGLQYTAITLGSRGAAHTSSPHWLEQIQLSRADEEDEELNLYVFASGFIDSKLQSAILAWVIVSKLHQPDRFDSQRDFCNKDSAAF